MNSFLQYRRKLLKAGLAGAAASSSAAFGLDEGGSMPGKESSFTRALHAPCPAADIADKLMLYGQFVGSWEAEARAYLPDGTTRKHYWQIDFAWALEGRAIQDIWVTPPRRGRRAAQSEPWGPFTNQYGTTLRFYDPKIDAWRVTWIDPATGYRANLTGRLENGGIFQEGSGSDGASLRWIFSDIGPNTFRWRAEISRDEGASWYKAIEMLAQRT